MVLLLQSLKLLSVLAAIRLDVESDDIDRTLVLALVEKSSTSDRSLTISDPLASSSWEKVGFPYFSFQKYF